MQLCNGSLCSRLVREALVTVRRPSLHTLWDYGVLACNNSIVRSWLKRMSRLYLMADNPNEWSISVDVLTVRIRGGKWARV